MMTKVFSLALLTVLFVPAAGAQSSQSQARKYPPIQEYLMPQASEIALAKSAAPATISDHATIIADDLWVQSCSSGRRRFRLHGNAWVLGPDVYAHAIPRSRVRFISSSADLL